VNDIEGVYRFVKHEDVATMEAHGWSVVGPMPAHHGYWSALMRWSGPGEPTTTCRDAVGILPMVNGSTSEPRT
jgi:hypothetical protein